MFYLGFLHLIKLLRYLNGDGLIDLLSERAQRKFLIF